MNAYGVQTAEVGERPHKDVFESLVGANRSKPIARLGWSYWDELDLRKLSKARREGTWKKGQKKENWDEAWGGHAFYDDVKEGDLLFYRNLPAQGRFTVVKVTGEYGYLKTDGDFRSYRPCKPMAENVQMSDRVVGTRLRTYLRLPRRICKIPTGLAEGFLNRFKSGPSRSRSSQTENNNGSYGKRERGRHPTDLDKLKDRFKYVIDRQKRTVNKVHQKYQIGLRDFLRARGLKPDTEGDFVDVSFLIDSNHYLGEVKVTNWLSLAEAFRSALGQILDYGSASKSANPRLVIFLDRRLDARRIKLATALGIAVVVSKERGNFVLENPSIDPVLERLFAGSCAQGAQTDASEREVD